MTTTLTESEILEEAARIHERKQLAALDEQFDEADQIRRNGVNDLIALNVTANESDTPPDEFAGELRKLASRLEAARMFFPDADALGQLRAEANRPEGFELPDTWGLPGIKILPGLPTMLGGYSGFGKSRTAINLVLDSIYKKRRILFFSVEMTPGQVWAALIAQDVYRQTKEQVSRSKILELVRKDDPRALDTIEYAREFLTVIDASQWKASEVCAQFDAYANRREREPDIVFLDYLQILTPEDPKLDRRLQIIDTMGLLTAKAKQSISAWVIVAQTNRQSHKEGRGKAGDHSSFQESAAIEQNAALTILIGRPEDEPYSIEINVSKNRFGPTTKRGKPHLCSLEEVTGFIENPL